MLSRVWESQVLALLVGVIVSVSSQHDTNLKSPVLREPLLMDIARPSVLWALLSLGWWYWIVEENKRRNSWGASL